MTPPRAFISFDYDNNLGHKVLFAGQSSNSKVAFTIQDWSSKEPLPQSKWEDLIKDKVSRCHMMIVLVGKQMRTSIGVAKEIQMATECNVPIFGVYVDGAGVFHDLPVGLSRYRVVGWDWEKVASMVQQMMSEGKNRSRF
jgi:MTH538 TIR-like domain (DUF1863)